jgi:hypothetical protein
MVFSVGGHVDSLLIRLAIFLALCLATFLKSMTMNSIDFVELLFSPSEQCGLVTIGTLTIDDDDDFKTTAV